MQDNQNDDIAKYAILTQAILGDPQLNSTDKIVLGRISGFARFYESAAATAEFCGLSERQVKDAKRKLEKLGYIVAIVNTGRGKAYRTAPDYLWAESRHTKKRTSDVRKNVCQTYEKTDTENKVRIKKELKGADAPAKAVENSEKEKEEFGDPAINAFMKRWASATSNDCSNIKRERRAAHNLLRSQTEQGIDAILAAVQQIHESGDQYAPNITLPSDLVGQYSKLSKLRLYVAKQDTQKRAKIKRTLVLDYDGLPPAYEVSEAERNKVKEQIKAMRESGIMPWQTQSA